MDIIKHKLCTHELGKPSDMTDEQCGALPVKYEQDEAGATWAVSFWKPSLEELQALQHGCCVTLAVRASGRQHPVVAIGTYKTEE